MDETFGLQVSLAIDTLAHYVLESAWFGVSELEERSRTIDPPMRK